MSMIAISGKPRGGKTLYAVGLLLEFLENDTRAIVTNIPLNLDQMVRYFCEKGLPDVEVYSRVQLLDNVQTGEFWRYRGVGVEPLERPPSKKKGFGDGEEYTPDWMHNQLQRASDGGGVIYFLDELHEHLNSRDWQTTARAVNDYAAKHGHLGDDIIWISQSVKNVDSQFRSRTQEYRYVRNVSKEKFMRYFNRSAGWPFKLSIYLEPYTGPSTHCQETRNLAFDPKVAACYTTSIFGGSADKDQKVGGLPLYWLFAILLIGCLLFGFALFKAPGVLTRWGIQGLMSSTEGALGETVQGNLAAVKPVSYTVTPSVTPVPSQTVAGASNSLLARSRLAGEPEYKIESKEEAHARLAPVSSVDSSPPVWRRVHLRNTRVADIAFDKIGQSGISFNPVASGNCVVVSASNEATLRYAADLIKALDQPAQDVEISAVIVERTVGHDHRLGAVSDLQTGVTIRPVSMASSFLAGGSAALLTMPETQSFGFLVQALERDSSVKVVSKPQIVVRAGNVGFVSVGREIPLESFVRDSTGTNATTTSYKTAATALKITPVVTEGVVRMTVDYSAADVLPGGGNGAPQLSTQSVITDVRLVGSDVLRLAGMTNETEMVNKTGVPGLSKVPGLGRIFTKTERQKVRRSLEIYLSARVLPAGGSRVGVDK